MISQRRIRIAALVVLANAAIALQFLPSAQACVDECEKPKFLCMPVNTCLQMSLQQKQTLCQQNARPSCYAKCAFDCTASAPNGPCKGAPAIQCNYKSSVPAPCPTCTESPTLNPPANFTAPSFSYSTVVAGPNGENWGNTNIQYSDANLSCAQICRNGGPAYRIEGDFSLTTSSITIRTQVPANGTCSAVARTAANISHTEGHELTHANALLGVINSWKSQIGTEYSGLAACQAALSSLKSIVAQAYTQEVSDQQNHVDHAGERRHAAVCPTANGSAAEVVCGLGGWNCSPSNTY